MEKLTRIEKDLLFFTVTKSEYFYEKVKGYQFNAKLKEGEVISCFVYKQDGLWYVNDNESQNYSFIITRGFKTRKEAVQTTIKKLSNVTMEKFTEAKKHIIEKAEDRIKTYKDVTTNRIV